MAGFCICCFANILDGRNKKNKVQYTDGRTTKIPLVKRNGGKVSALTERGLGFGGREYFPCFGSPACRCLHSTEKECSFFSVIHFSFGGH